MASGILADLLQEVTLRQRLLPLTTALLLLVTPASARGQVTALCHATGDPNTPYQLVEVAPEATLEHLQHGEDIVPAPPEGCPAQLVADEVDPAYPLPTVTAAPDVVPSPQQRPRRRRASRRPSPAAPRGQVAPAITSGNLGATAEVESETLPMTGAEVPMIALMGFGFLLAGAGLRLRYVGR